MGMWSDAHCLVVVHLHRAHVVQEAPRPDGPAGSPWQGSPHRQPGDVSDMARDEVNSPDDGTSGPWRSAGTSDSVTGPVTGSWVLLPAEAIDVDGRQILHFLLGEGEADAVFDPRTAPIGMATSLRPQR